MTENKNYCVDGKCTAFTPKDEIKCLFFSAIYPNGIQTCSYCDIPFLCVSERANAEWMKTNGK